MNAARRRGPLRYFFRAPGYLYRWHLGSLLGHRFLLLTHTGRRSGLRRQTVLEIVEYREPGPDAVVMSAFGYGSDWLLNITARPDEEVQIGSRRFRASHRVLGEDEAVRVLEGYERRNWFSVPIVRWALSWVLGWSYRSTEDHRRRLVRQIPLIAFRPQL